MKHIWTAALAAILVISGCKKDNNMEGTTRLDVRLTDNPFDAESVNIDIEKVTVRFDDDLDANENDDDWWILETNDGVYDLLDYQNGVNTVIATGEVPRDRYVREIRLILGDDNTIVINGVDHALTIPSGSESGLKIKVDKKLNRTVEDILVDFDADLSIHQTGNGKYMLKPVLKVVN